MNEKPWKLLRLHAKTETELKEKYRQVYINEYVKQEIFDWFGNQVIFPLSQFDHAFSESSNYKQSFGVHDIPFSERRARYILWIKEVLNASTSTVDYSIEYRTELRKKKGKSVVTKSFLLIEERYIVVLDTKPNRTELFFITAYVADKNYVKKLRNRSILLENKKVPSSHGD